MLVNMDKIFKILGIFLKFIGIPIVILVFITNIPIITIIGLCIAIITTTIINWSKIKSFFIRRKTVWGIIGIIITVILILFIVLFIYAMLTPIY